MDNAGQWSKKVFQLTMVNPMDQWVKESTRMFVKGRTPPDHHPSFWIVRPLPSDTSLISLCHVCLENPASSGHSTSRGPSEHLIESTSSLANTQMAENSLDSPLLPWFHPLPASRHRQSVCLQCW
ncbi:hypothetical protein E2C01_038709 [Portunus trituberculatus]|uniref:Uncharacterized protein n=1 Tax=Portunus trituberculatus TaxID=210409 RepID=A0A5B7FHV7_PORTR|nr:hypothetical protein [Portunus trituberculatus]